MIADGFWDLPVINFKCSPCHWWTDECVPCFNVSSDWLTGWRSPVMSDWNLLSKQIETWCILCLTLEELWFQQWASAAFCILHYLIRLYFFITMSDMWHHILFQCGEPTPDPHVWPRARYLRTCSLDWILMVPGWIVMHLMNSWPSLLCHHHTRISSCCQDILKTIKKLSNYFIYGHLS